jgi:hypothetical protein
VVEGILDDLKRGYVPNIFAEQRMKAEWKYNPKGLVKKIEAGAVLTTAAVAFIYYKNNSSRKRKGLFQ